MPRTCCLMGIIVLSTVILGATPKDTGPQADERDVSFRVRVCEGDEVKRLLGSEATEAWNDCTQPLADTSVVLRAGEAQAGPSATGKDGVASVGPIRVKRDQRITLVVGSKEHLSLKLDLDPIAVGAGVNYFLYRTKRLEQLKDKHEGS
jgi:hypothetical protein